MAVELLRSQELPVTPVISSDKAGDSKSFSAWPTLLVTKSPGWRSSFAVLSDTGFWSQGLYMPIFIFADLFNIPIETI